MTGSNNALRTEKQTTGKGKLRKVVIVIGEDCEMRENCPFYQTAQNMEEETVSGAFFVIYCKGPKENDCAIRDLAGELERDIIPDNMMPNGNPIPGTGGEEEWPDEVKGAVGP